MSIRDWWASRRQRKLEAYDKNHAYATAEEQKQLKRRNRVRSRLSGPGERLVLRKPWCQT
jgi:hypothetical protein